MAQRAQLMSEAGDTDGGWSHVHAPAARAEVHGDADDVDGLAAAGGHAEELSAIG
jgi:hypothetical protein